MKTFNLLIRLFLFLTISVKTFNLTGPTVITVATENADPNRWIDAKILAEKFTTLYFLCRDLLSKAAHYDWGLRAIKSVLVVAGSFKRAEPSQSELAILLRALRDFNIPKIVAEDTDIFAGLLSDLFPGINVPRNRNMAFEHVIEKAVGEAKFYPDPEFILKVV